MARALALLDLLHVSDARTELDQALSIDGDNIAVLGLRGRIALSDGAGDQAIAFTERALRLAPNDPDLLATRASLAFRSQDLPQALSDINKALKIKPDDIDALFIRAQLYLHELHNSAHAFTDLSEMLALAPDDRRALTLRADLSIHRKQYDLAALDSAKVLAKMPGDPEMLITQAEARTGLGNESGAIASYTILLDEQGAGNQLTRAPFRQAMLDRARLYAKANRNVEAHRDIEAIIAQGGVRALLRMQLYLHENGFPNVGVTGSRSSAFDDALIACFNDTICGPQIVSR